MIILTPHSLANHLLEGDISNDDHGASIPYIIDSIISCREANSTSEQQQLTHPRPKAVEHNNNNNIRQELEHWQETRLKVSKALGSIGAPPLTLSFIEEEQQQSSKLIFDLDHDTSKNNSTPNRPNIDETRSSSSSSLSSSTSFHIDLLNDISEMAEAHTELLQTIDRILDTLSGASSIQLGIGPNVAGNFGNGRLVARAENAWIVRQRLCRQQQKRHVPSKLSKDEEGYCTTNNVPMLTLQKLRNLIHRAIVDQAISMFGMFDMLCQTVTAAQQEQSTVVWKIFVQDLRHSLQLPGTILTLSQLSSWRNRSGEFLSVLLSNFLSEQQQHGVCVKSKLLVTGDDYCHDLPSIRMASVLKSSQWFAKERRVFLQSACPLSRPHTNECHDDGDDGGGGCLNSVIENESKSVDADQYAEQKKRQLIRRKSERIIGNLQVNLDAARIALWAFGQAYSASTTQETVSAPAATTDHTASLATDYHDVEDRKSAQIWWFHFKEMMDRSFTTMSEIDEYFQSIDAGLDAEGEGEELNSTVMFDPSRAKKAECSEHIDDAIGIGDETLLLSNGCSGVQSNYPNIAGKTLIFSGSGIKTPHQLQMRFKSRSSLSSPNQEILLQPPPREVNDQLLLLQDLEKRIKTLGLVDEYEVTQSDIDSDVGGDESAVEKDREYHEGNSITVSSNVEKTIIQNQSFSVSGPLLMELKSAIKGNAACDAGDP